MKRKKLLNLKLLGILAVFACLLSGCTKKIELQDGFEVVRIYGDVQFLVKPDNRELVMPNIAAAVDDEQFIVGLRGEIDPEFRQLDPDRDQPYGYFIYDKTTEELIMGLSKDELAELSEERGIELRLE